jgi:bacteriocin biosynthesis cyclodehydratase domain
MTDFLMQDCRQGHSRMLERLDARAQRLQADEHSTMTAPRRLAASQVYLVAGGQVGLQTARMLATQGLGHLTIVAATAQDHAALHDAFTAGADSGRNVMPTAYDIYAAALQLGMHQLICFASSRPHPAVQNELNEAAVRLGIPFVQASLFAHEVQLGPTVIPGATACHACYQMRLKANYARLDVPEARDRFLDRNPGFQFNGRLASVDALAASLAASEVSRVLGNHAPPVALSTEVSINALTQTRQRHFIPYVEWCAVCSSARPQQQGTEFSAFVAAIAR